MNVKHKSSLLASFSLYRQGMQALDATTSAGLSDGALVAHQYPDISNLK
jgi:hypothetical protein